MLKFIFILFFTTSLFAQENSMQNLDDLFSAGLKNYNEGRMKESWENYQLALEIQPNNTSLLYNAGLSLYRMGEAGLALALWRKALYLDPGFIEVELAINESFNKLEHKELPHKATAYETIRETVLNNISLKQVTFILGLVLFSACWSLLTWIGGRRRALDDAQIPPPVTFRTVFLTSLCIAVLLIWSLKLYDQLLPRGVITVKSVEAHALPDSGSPSLFTLYEGLEVILNDKQDDWVKATYPGGRSGWIPSSQVFQVWGKNL